MLNRSLLVWNLQLRIFWWFEWKNKNNCRANKVQEFAIYVCVPSSSFPVGKTVGAISCTTMTLFTKCYRPPLGTRINNTVPALKTTAVNRPVPALKKKRPSRREQKIQPPGPGAEKTQPPRPVPPRKKNTTAPSRLGKKYNRPVPPRKKTTTAPSRFEKKKRPPRPASEKKTTAPSRLEKKNNRPVPPRILPRKIPFRQEFPPLYFASPALPPKWKRWVNRQFSPVPSRWDFSRPCKALQFSRSHHEQF